MGIILWITIFSDTFIAIFATNNKSRGKKEISLFHLTDLLLRRGSPSHSD